MAIDTEAKIRSTAEFGTGFGTTPDAAKGAPWLQAMGGIYSGIASEAPAESTGVILGGPLRLDRVRPADVSILFHKIRTFKEEALEAQFVSLVETANRLVKRIEAVAAENAGLLSRVSTISLRIVPDGTLVAVDGSGNLIEGDASDAAKLARFAVHKIEGSDEEPRLALAGGEMRLRTVEANDIEAFDWLYQGTGAANGVKVTRTKPANFHRVGVALEKERNGYVRAMFNAWRPSVDLAADVFGTLPDSMLGDLLAAADLGLTITGGAEKIFGEDVLLTLAQDIRASASPQFEDLTLTGELDVDGTGESSILGTLIVGAGSGGTGAAWFTQGNAFSIIVVRRNNANGRHIGIWSSTTGGGLMYDDGNPFFWHTQPKADAGTGANATERMRLDETGRLGVGVTPDTRLHVAGAIRSTEGLRQDWVTPAQITANVDNYDPALAHFYRLSADAPHTIYAWAAPAAGERNWFTAFNVDSSAITLSHDASPNGADPSPGNEMLMIAGSDFSLAAGLAISFAYDPTTQKWRQYA